MEMIRSAPETPVAEKPQPDRLPLQSGDHLTRAEFERRYQAHPELKKAELVEGVVYVPSPVSVNHAEPHSAIMTILGVYHARTRGIRLMDNVTVRLDLENEVQPDACLFLRQEAGGKTRVDEEGYIAGAPELVVEIAVSSASYDLHDKLRVYRRNGVGEYLVFVAYEQEVIWYGMEEGEYRPFSPNDNNVLQSRIFPGLQLDADLFWQNDLAALLELVEAGINSPEHEAFVAELEAGMSQQ